MADPKGYPEWVMQSQQVWQPYAMGGGQWVRPPVVTLSDADVERIARAVVRLLKGTGEGDRWLTTNGWRVLSCCSTVAASGPAWIATSGSEATDG